MPVAAVAENVTLTDPRDRSPRCCRKRARKMKMAPRRGHFHLDAPSVAAALLARDRAAVVALDLGGHHAAIFARADPDAARTNANGHIGITPAFANNPVLPHHTPVLTDADLDADLRHLQILRLGRGDPAKRRSSGENCSGSRRGKRESDHLKSLSVSVG